MNEIFHELAELVEEQGEGLSECLAHKCNEIKILRSGNNTTICNSAEEGGCSTLKGSPYKHAMHVCTACV